MFFLHLSLKKEQGDLVQMLPKSELAEQVPEDLEEPSVMQVMVHGG